MPTTLKLDIDIPQLKKDKNLFQAFLNTRIAIIEKIGLNVKRIRWQETEKGYHFWITLNQDVIEQRLCDLQFLLGDDQIRCRFNYLRLEAGCFNQFNVLFNRKFKNKQKTITPTSP